MGATRFVLLSAVCIVVVTATDWEELAREDLKRTMDLKVDYAKANNVVFFVGDGMGPATVTASRTFMAQTTQGLDDVTVSLSWEDFPVTGLSKVPNADRRVPDSAASATAMLCGQKANFYTVGVTDKVKLADCSNIQYGNRLKSALKHAVDRGKWVGLITNTRVTHATPAAAYASSARRDWEAEVPEDQLVYCKDIAYQLVHDEFAKQFRVVLGGGLQQFYPNTTATVPGGDIMGKRSDGRNLVEEWKEEKRMMGVADARVKFMTSEDDLSVLDPMHTDYLLGLFSPSYMAYEAHRLGTNEPSLTTMVIKALQILKRGPNGFFLFVEGGLIDKAHHVNKAHLALVETVEMQYAVAAALENTDARETLTVVTADHSHTMTIGGYPEVDVSILGTHQDEEYDEPSDGMPYTILGYHNGPGWFAHRLNETGQPINRNVTGLSAPVTRRNITEDDTMDPDYEFDAGIPSFSETHGGEDVAIYAHGPSAYLFSGVHQQHYIAHALMSAACLGSYDGGDDCPVLAAAMATKPWWIWLTIVTAIMVKMFT